MPNEKKLILIVDDDLINREVLKNVFSSHYQITEAENGVEGLAKLDKRKNELAAILLDVNMPIMNGIEMLRILHERGITSRIPVFLVTAHEESDIAKEAYELDVMDIINKPITPFVILRRVQSIIELFSARETLSATVMGQERKLRENADTIDELHRGTIEALAAAIEFRDVESGEHTARIYGITKYILSKTEMGKGFTENEIESMSIGSIMHDIGKIAISDTILNKPGRLTPEEFEIMKQHTVKGAQLMEQLTQLQSHDSYIYACDIARYHHERYDGGGYPDGLAGDDISIWSQVVSIADVYDALVSERVYKRAVHPDTAVQMIQNGECGAFSPKLIKCFLTVEPDIRKWYLSNDPSDKMANTVKMAEGISLRSGSTLAEEIKVSQNLTEVMLLTAAVKSAYDLIIFSNLTKNTYYIPEYERFVNHTADPDGVFDDLIAAGLSTIPLTHNKQFYDKYARENQLKAFAEGIRNIALSHKQFADDGTVHDMETRVLLMDDSRTGDVMNVTLSRCVDK